MSHLRKTEETDAGPRLVAAAALVFLLVAVLAMTACGGGDGNDAAGGSSGNISGGIGSGVVVGDALVVVKSLQAAFQPVSPAQKLSDDPLIAPETASRSIRLT